MRKIYSLALALMAGATAFGQLTHTVNNGEFKITYGKSADWSIFDPQGAPTIYLHVWSSQADGDNDKGNFDRVMAFMMVMIYLQELHNVHVKEKKKIERNNRLFDTPIFSEAWFESKGGSTQPTLDNIPTYTF